jgi:penicillin G amidase
MNIKKIVIFLITISLTFGLVKVLQISLHVKGNTLPPLGSFLNPFSGFWRNAEPKVAIPGQNAELKIPGLKEPVEVVFDKNMIPHIFANNTEDAMMAQGYIVAQHRLWQMDIITRRAAGRLSEVMGNRTIDSDRKMRRRGMLLAAQKDVEGWAKFPDEMKLVEAYTRGVNAYIQQLTERDLPIEFKLLNYQPEEWSVLKSALVTESMADNLCGQEDDAEATFALEKLGKTTFDYLFPENNPKMIPVIADEGQWKNLKPTLGKGTMPTPFVEKNTTPSPAKTSWNDDKIPQPLRDLNGSNNWALSGKHTANKAPILANDPHLLLSLPSIWYQVHLHTPTLNTEGVTFPGIPGVVIGFNENIAWGVTNASHDVIDWYKINWTDKNKTSYSLDGATKKVKYQIETIQIKGESTLLDTVKYTDWGPIAYDYMPDHPLHDCAMRWVIHEGPDGNQLGFFSILNAAKNYDDYRKALKGFDNPAQNFIFASKSGDIAMTVQGRLPLRGPQQGRTIQDGSKSENAWHGYIPDTDLPFQKNPAAGYLSSANQRSAANAYPYYYLGNFEDFRNRRINQRLSTMENATIDSMKSMQLDNYSQLAADALPEMLKLLDTTTLNPVALLVLSTLKKWDYRYEKESDASTLFDLWFDATYKSTWDEMENLQKDKQKMLFPEYWRFIYLLEKDPKNIFFDNTNTADKTETAKEIVTESFNKMLEESAKKTLTGGLSWAKNKGFTVNHIGFIKPFGRTDIEVGGAKSAVNAISAMHGPSWRMIVELGDTTKAYGIFPGGQSGNPGSIYYDNMLKDWAEGKYYEMVLYKTPAEVPEPLQKITFKKLF